MNPRSRVGIREAQSRLSAQWPAYRQAIRKPGPDALKQAFTLIRQLELLTSQLYRCRASLPASDPFRAQLEDFAADLFQETLATGNEKTKPELSGFRAWSERYRAIWQENFALFLLTAALFAGSALAGWHIAIHDPSLASAIVPQRTLEDIVMNRRWFDELGNGWLLGGLGIALNNIKVGIKCFVLSSLLGIGGLLLMAYNGLFFGFVLGFCRINGFDGALAGFVAGHGPLELSIIVASTFAGLVFGRVFFMRPYSLFRQRLGLAASDAGCLLTGILPWLLLAAFIEAFISPMPGIPLRDKGALGLIASLFFWGWTLWPSKGPSGSGSKRAPEKLREPQHDTEPVPLRSEDHPAPET